VEKETVLNGVFSFQAKSPSGTNNVMRILLSAEPKGIEVKEANRKIPVPFTSIWDNDSKTLLLQFANNADGVDVEMRCR